MRTHILLSACLLFFLLPLTAGAQNAQPNQNNFCELEPFGCFEAPFPNLSGGIAKFVEGNKGNAAVSYLGIIVNTVIGIIIFIAVIMIVFGGYVYMTAGGNSDRVGKAKTIIGSALLGIILALTTFIILDTINPKIGTDVVEPVLSGEICAEQCFDKCGGNRVCVDQCHIDCGL